MQFQLLRQFDSESILEWADRVLQLSINAYRHVGEEFMHQQALMKFCQALSNMEEGQYAVNARPKSMEDAMDKVKWYQYNHMTMFLGWNRERIEP